ncbi:hypothetical protein HK100_001418 [Physocladia obscura]|uniref:G domain-containing protein n=1 Tax=Physocladia obscura TaxID=109957 RepID=A0AAD5SX53_9FUNG|nr:hypothetical protein HK100_001418 [Physocladia obscura]
MGDNHRWFVPDITSTIKPQIFNSQCKNVDDHHRRFICSYTCDIESIAGGPEKFMRSICNDKDVVELVDREQHWTKSFVYHDIAAHISTPNVEMYERAVKFLGTTMLDAVNPNSNETPLSTAIKFHNLHFINYLASLPVDCVNFSRILHGKSYLFIAASCSNYDIIKAIYSVFKNKYNNLIDRGDEENNESPESPYDICGRRSIPDLQKLFFSTPTTDNEVLNIMIVGSSQVGKSAFIKYLHEYNNINQTIPIGNGVNSCTTKSSHYLLEHKYKEWFPLIGSNGKRILTKTIITDEPYQPKNNTIQLTKNLFQGKISAPSTIEDLYDQSNLDIHEICYTKHSRNIRIIDTPGIGDTDDKSNGKDESHVMGFLNYLDSQKISTLHAVLLLVKPDTATQEIKERIRYYYKLFNSGSIYIVFTHYNKDAILNDFDNNVNIQKKRVEYLEMCDIQAPPYIFNVSVIPPSTIKLSRRDFVTEYLTNVEINKLFASIIRSSQPINVFNLKFEKTKLMLQKEKAIVDFINGRLMGLEDGIRQYDTTAANYTKDYTALSKQISSKRDQIQKIKDELADKNNENLYLLTEKVYCEQWYWFQWREPKVFSYTTTFPIDNNGIDVNTWKGVTAEIMEKSQNSIKISIKSNWFQKQDASIKVFTLKRFYFSSDIQNLYDQLRKTEGELLEIENSFTTVKANSENLQCLSEKERNRIRKFADVSEFFSNKDISRVDYNLLKDLYHSSSAIDDSIIDKIYQRKLAENACPSIKHFV